MLGESLLRRVDRRAGLGRQRRESLRRGRISTGGSDLTRSGRGGGNDRGADERGTGGGEQLLAGELAGRFGPVMDGGADQAAGRRWGSIFRMGMSRRSCRPRQVRARCVEVIESLGRKLDGRTQRFERLSRGDGFVLVGRPNAGKSTLLNALAGTDRAVVSNIAGTTRDAIWAEVRLGRGLVRVVDVAGLEEGSGAEDEIDAADAGAGAAREVSEADGVIWVLRAGR